MATMIPNLTPRSNCGATGPVAASYEHAAAKWNRRAETELLMQPHDTTILKYCPECQVEKPLGEFRRDRSRKDGCGSYCKLCNREIARRWRQANYERDREKVRRWDKENPDKKLERARRWRQANREKSRAHDAVYRSVLAGDLPPVSDCFCFICGTSSDQDARMEYHHVRYDKPLEVFPLCNPCHADWHKGNGEMSCGD